MTAAGLRETVLAPEGVELHFGTGSAAERIVALTVDLLIVLVLLLVLGFLAGAVLGIGGVLLVAFFVRHGYFLWFEARSNGRTPGKRLFHLRVIRADGGPLTTEVLLARNLTREVELFLPVMVMASPDLLFADHAGVTRVLASLWVLLLLFFPLLNARRLRIGDLLAGTRVVVSPPAPLLRDLADRGGAPGVAVPDDDFRFTPQQLEIYGEHELEVLEELLRKHRAAGSHEAFAAVTKSICKRIGYDRGAIGGRHEQFLRAFYREQRRHLEQRLLLGKRRLRKRAKRPQPGAE